MSKTAQEQAQEVFDKITGDPLDILYYIVVMKKGVASFRDLIGHTVSINAINEHMPLHMKEIHGGGFTITSKYVEAFAAVFEVAIENGSYVAPTFGRR
jgi:hypothetical protein